MSGKRCSPSSIAARSRGASPGTTSPVAARLLRHEVGAGNRRIAAFGAIPSWIPRVAEASQPVEPPFARGRRRAA